MTNLTSDQKAQVYEFVQSELSRFNLIESNQADEHIAFKLKTAEKNIFQAKESITVPMRLVNCKLTAAHIIGECKYPLTWSAEGLSGYGYPSYTDEAGNLQVGYSTLTVGDVVALNTKSIHMDTGSIPKGEIGVITEIASSDEGDKNTYMVKWGERGISASAARYELKHLPNSTPPVTIEDKIEANKHRQPDDDTEEQPVPYDDSDARWERKVEEEECESLASPDGLLQIDRDDYVALLESDSAPPPNSGEAGWGSLIDELRREKAAATRRADLAEQERDKLKESSAIRERTLAAVHKANNQLQAQIDQLKAQVEQLASIIPADAPRCNEKVIKYAFPASEEEATRIYNAGYEIIEKSIVPDPNGNGFVFNIAYARPITHIDKHSPLNAYQQTFMGKFVATPVSPSALSIEPAADPVLNSIRTVVGTIVSAEPEAKMPYAIALEQFKRGNITLEEFSAVGDMQAFEAGFKTFKGRA